MSQPGAAARQLFWRVGETDRGIARPVSDPQLQGGLSGLALDAASTKIVFGKIVDTAGAAHCYKVMAEKGMPTLTAVHLGGTSFSMFGSRQLNTLQPGTNVWMIVHRQAYYAVIIGVEPPAMSDAKQGLADFITQCSRQRVDIGELQPILMDDNGGVTDWLAGRPFDGTMVGEWGAIAETGMKVFLDPFLAAVALDDATGLFVFYHDQLVRLASYNLQLYTAGSERDALDDQLEYSDYEGFTPYPWEHLGLFERGDPLTKNEAQQMQIDDPHYSTREPAEDDQIPWHRLQKFRGYLGQGGRRMIVAPPPSPSGEQNRLSEDQTFAGLFDEQLSLTGRYAVRSAKGIWFIKSPEIPVPKRKLRPEDPNGDTDENYKFSGLEGGGDDHVVKGEIEDTGDKPQLTRIAGVLDQQAYIYNWDGLHPFHYHEQDWLLPQESELEYVGEKEPVEFDALAEDQYIEPPEPFKVKVDERYGEVQYFPNRSYFGMLDDGGIVLGDGYGSEIRMTGGSIFLTAPGDVWTKSGRNIVQWGGHDINIRARDSIDVATTQHDIRLKAERNMQVLGGNDGEQSESRGGVLIESRASQPVFDFSDKVGEDVDFSGIVMRSPNAPIVNWGKDIYLRTGGGEGDRKIQKGQIVLDAARGEQSIVAHANTLDLFTRSVLDVHFGTEGNVRKTATVSESGAFVPGQVCTDGFVVAGRGISSRGSIAVIGHIATTQAEAFDGKVGQLNNATPVALAASQCEEQTNSVGPDRGTNAFDSILQAGFYDDQRPGNDGVIDQAGFSFRNQEQYGTIDWQLFEDRWQQIARLQSGGLPKWEEREVQSGSEKTFPYPGREHLSEESSFKTLDLAAHDPQTDRAKDRDDDFYEEPKFEEPSSGVLNDEYTVVVSDS